MSAESQIVKVPPPPKTGWPFRGGFPSVCYPILLAAVVGCGMFKGPDPEPADPPTPTEKEKDSKEAKKPWDAPVLRRPRPEQHPDGKIKESKRHWVRVLKVIDGVTFSLDNLHVVRLIGVARPKPFADKKYKEFFEEVTTPAVRQIVEGKRVFLMRDKAIKGRDGRSVIYMFLDDKTMLNATLIQKGYGRLSREVPFKFQDEFRLWERDAQSIGLGYWGPDDD